jgi:hypothetical protein
LKSWSDWITEDDEDEVVLMAGGERLVVNDCTSGVFDFTFEFYRRAFTGVEIFSYLGFLRFSYTE